MTNNILGHLRLHLIKKNEAHIETIDAMLSLADGPEMRNVRRRLRTIKNKLEHENKLLRFS